MHPFQGPRSPQDVYATAGPDVSLSDLDAACGFTTHVEGDLDRLWARWLEAIARVPLRNLADDDLARALDGGLHLPLVLPMALGRLREAADEAVPDRLMTAAAKAARRMRPRLAALAEETRAVLDSLSRREGPHSTESSVWATPPSWKDAAQAALQELDRSVPLEQAPGWREPPSPMAPRPPADEFKPRDGQIRSPYRES